MSGYNLPPGVSQRDIDRFYGFDDEVWRLELDDDMDDDTDDEEEAA